jgi:hypothetical protein
MRNGMTMSTGEKTWVPLSAKERRVLGVLIEKQKTTPEYYPMTVSALVAGCNQKSNRDPVTSYDSDDLEETLPELRRKGAVVMVEGAGRAVKWKHALYDWFDLRNKPMELAILAELMLRGPQTEGELRSRASRMDPIPDLAALQGILESLAGRGLVVYLTPPGQRRGVVVTHGLYPPEELERVRQAHASSHAAQEPAPAATSALVAASATPEWLSQVERLAEEVGALREQVRSLAQELRDLKSSLGA